MKLSEEISTLRDKRLEKILLEWWPRDKDFMTDEWIKHRSAFGAYLELMRPSFNAGYEALKNRLTCEHGTKTPCSLCYKDSGDDE